MAIILLVEDEVHTARVLSIWLVRHGHKVLEAHNGREALDALKREAVDMIISDMNMPLLDGLGLAKAVRTELGLQVPMLIVTARCDQARIRECAAEFDVAIYPKPFVPSRLVADVERMLTAAEARDGTS